MIPDMMIMEIPFPMPFSVMRSPIHMRKMEPVVMPMMALRKKSGVGEATRAFTASMAYPTDMMAAIPTVPHRVYLVRIFRPSRPRCWSSLSLGKTATNSDMMMETLI